MKKTEVTTTYSAQLQGILEDGSVGYLREFVCAKSMSGLASKAKKQIELWKCPQYKEFRMEKVKETIETIRTTTKKKEVLANPFRGVKNDEAKWKNTLGGAK